MPPVTPAARQAIDKLVAQSTSLYSLPTVAMEVLKLTENESVDVPALKQAIERDPALVIKLLRVVNSSMFGLSGEVSSLTQALAVLGARPLKMIVLGFSLPEALFEGVPGGHLAAFWRGSLTRALVARELAADRFELPPGGPAPDDAFIAGLLQDVGLLALFGQLGAPYANLLDNAAKEGVPPTDLEGQSLGFNRTQLSAAMASQWRLPAAITEAIQAAASGDALDTPTVNLTALLAKPLQLADLVVKLVVEKQLAVLPMLKERGAAYCGLTDEALRELIESVEERLPDLAAAMAAPLGGDADYQQTLADAHARLALVVENAAATPRFDDDAVCEALLAECHELRVLMQEALRSKPTGAAKLIRAEGAHTPVKEASTDDASPGVPPAERERLHDALTKLARQTRASRHALSLALVSVEADLDNQADDRRLRVAITEAGQQLGERRAARLTLTPRLVALLLPAVARSESMAFVQEIEQRVGESDEPLRLHAGVASIDAVPNRFDVGKLIDAAEGCLSAAQRSGAARVRSIEVY